MATAGSNGHNTIDICQDIQDSHNPHHTILLEADFTFTLIDKYGVQSRDDYEVCDISGSCLIEDGSILLTDYENQNIKKLDTGYEVTDSLSLFDAPTAICVTGQEEAVVCFGWSARIQFVSIRSDARMTTTRQFYAQAHCHGIACYNGVLFISCGGPMHGPPCVKVFTLDGQLLSIFENNIEGKNIFSFPQHIAISSDGNTLYIADRDTGVVTIDKSGKPFDRLTNNMAETSSVCIVARDRVVYCGGGQAPFLKQIDQNGHTKTIQLSDADGLLAFPKSILNDYRQSRLVMSFCSNNLIYVFNVINSSG